MAQTLGVTSARSDRAWRLSESGYFRAKLAQEKLIKESSIPYSIVRATEFFEFVKSIADMSTDGNTVRLAPVLIQPIAADDVASALESVAIGSPLNGTVQVAGPEQFRLDELIRRALSARNDPREVIADPRARYAGGLLDERTLLPGPDTRLGETRFEDWLSRSIRQIPASKAQPAPLAAAPDAPPALGDNGFRVSDVPPGSSLLVGEVTVFNVGGRFCATQSRCTHRQGSLSKGKLDGTTVTCPLHGAQFNVCTDAVLRGPATEPLKTYRVIVEGAIGRVEVGVLI
jgi:nitrite reductase/ring-hydroxylating ferredoxin subunit